MSRTRWKHLTFPLCRLKPALKSGRVAPSHFRQGVQGAGRKRCTPGVPTLPRLGRGAGRAAVDRRAGYRAFHLQRLLRRRCVAGITFVSQKLRQWPLEGGVGTVQPGVPERDGAPRNDQTVSRTPLPRPGLSGDEARSAEREILHHRAECRPPDRPLRCCRRRRRRTPLYAVLRRGRRGAAADAAPAP